jgi:hypothetical protein
MTSEHQTVDHTNKIMGNWSEKIPITPFYPWIPETRNLHN